MMAIEVELNLDKPKGGYDLFAGACRSDFNVEGTFVSHVDGWIIRRKYLTITLKSLKDLFINYVINH